MQVTLKDIRDAVVAEYLDDYTIHVCSSWPKSAKLGDYVFVSSDPAEASAWRRDIARARRDVEVLAWAAENYGFVRRIEKAMLSQFLDSYAGNLDVGDGVNSGRLTLS